MNKYVCIKMSVKRLKHTSSNGNKPRFKASEGDLTSKTPIEVIEVYKSNKSSK